MLCLRCFNNEPSNNMTQSYTSQNKGSVEVDRCSRPIDLYTPALYIPSKNIRIYWAWSFTWKHVHHFFCGLNISCPKEHSSALFVPRTSHLPSGLSHFPTLLLQGCQEQLGNPTRPSPAVKRTVSGGVSPAVRDGVMGTGCRGVVHRTDASDAPG